jgi:hypothetical protein
MTKDMNDSYMGSGKQLGYAKKKYGIENFKKEILSTHETPEEMFAEEARLVNEEFVGRDDVYNLTCGGRGSWVYVNATLTEEQRIIVARTGGIAASKNHPNGSDKRKELNEKLKKVGDILRNKVANETFIPSKVFWQITLGKTKQKMSDARKDSQLGSKNSQFGTCWVKR